MTGRAPLIALLLLLGSIATLAATPTAMACSLAGDYDYGDHGLLHVKNIEDGDHVVSLRVEHRSLGASCELSNPTEIDGDTVVWSEARYAHDDDRVTIHRHDLRTGANEVVHDLESRFTERLAIHDEAIIHISNIPDGTYHSGETRYSPVAFVIHPDEEPEMLAFDAEDVRLAHGPWLAWTTNNDEANMFHAYHWTDDTWYALGGRTEKGVGVPLASMGLPEDAVLRAIDERWAIFLGREAPGSTWAYDLIRDSAHDLTARLPDRSYIVGLAGDQFYHGAGSDIQRTLLPEGPSEPMSSLGGDRHIAIDDTHYILGQYSTGPNSKSDAAPVAPNNDERDGALRWIDPEDDASTTDVVSLPGPGALFSVLGALIAGRTLTRRH